MSNKVNAIKALGVAVPASVDSIDTNGGKSYFLRPGKAYKPGREHGKQALAIALASRPQGVSLERLTSAMSERGKKYDVAAAKSYLSKDFAGRKGLGVYWRVASVRDYLASFGDDERKAETAALRDSQRKASESSGVVVMHVWHEGGDNDAGVGRAPQAGDYDADGQAAGLLGLAADKADKAQSQPKSGNKRKSGKRKSK